MLATVDGVQASLPDLLAARDEAWGDQVEVVAMDGFSGFKTATIEEQLHIGATLLTDHQQQWLTHPFARDEHVEVQATRASISA